MVKVIIPQDQLIMGQPAAISVLKYSATYGLEKGFNPTKRIYVEVGGIPMEYDQLQRFNAREGMEITLIQEDNILDSLNKKISMFIQSLEQGKAIPFELTSGLKIEILYIYMEAILEGFSICHAEDIRSEKSLIVKKIDDIRGRFKEGTIETDRFWNEILGEAKYEI